MTTLRLLLQEITPPIVVRAARKLLSRRPAEAPAVQAEPAPPPPPAVIEPEAAQGSIVTAMIHGVPIRMDRNHALPHYVADHPLYDTAISYLAKYIADRRACPIVIVDVGANIGDTACLAARLLPENDVRFICVEGSDEYLDLLRENTSSMQAEIIHAVACADISATGRRMISSGAGTSVVVDGGVNNERTLDDIIAGRPVDLIKIDTDGFELEVIGGARHTIAACEPDLFLEFSPYHVRTFGKTEPRNLMIELDRLGYREALVYDNLGHAFGVMPVLGEAMQVLTHYSESRAGFYLDLFLSKSNANLQAIGDAELQRTKLAEGAAH